MSRKNESEILRVHGVSVFVPAFHAPCTYVRFEENWPGGKELAYWDVQEWTEDPAGVMGAIMGAMRSAALGESIESCDECNGTRFPAERHEKHCSLHTEDETVPCVLCHKDCPVTTAHAYQGGWVGDDCCWDERLRTTE